MCVSLLLIVFIIFFSNKKLNFFRKIAASSNEGGANSAAASTTSNDAQYQRFLPPTYFRVAFYGSGFPASLAGMAHDICHQTCHPSDVSCLLKTSLTFVYSFFFSSTGQEFIYRGFELERASDFTQRIQNKFPQSTLLNFSDNSPPPDIIKANGQCM